MQSLFVVLLFLILVVNSFHTYLTFTDRDDAEPVQPQMSAAEIQQIVRAELQAQAPAPVSTPKPAAQPETSSVSPANEPANFTASMQDKLVFVPDMVVELSSEDGQDRVLEMSIILAPFFGKKAVFEPFVPEIEQQFKDVLGSKDADYFMDVENFPAIKAELDQIGKDIAGEDVYNETLIQKMVVR